MLLKSYRNAPPVFGDAASDDTPQALKKYRLLGRLATGGMAELFLARTAGLGGFERLLVIKRPRPELARDTEFVRMLLDEARIVATLSHSNIVQVFDVDMVDGNVFFAMEHLHGRHVAELMRRAQATAARIPLENAIAIAISVAAGLHYAHERWGPDGQSLGIVHRDVAPNNVIVTYDGNVKLIDFGIAKAVNNLSTTRFGLFKGKLPYASPEQIRCEPVDRRTDVYSLGILLYELTTGSQLFTADSEFALLRAMSEAVVPRPRLRDKAYPRELEQIVLKALARDPAERYQTAQALQRDLEVLAGQLRLNLSAFSLSRLMESLFDEDLGEWKSAQRAGLTLEQHITRSTGAYTLETLDTAEVPIAEVPIADAEPPPDPVPVHKRTERMTSPGATFPGHSGTIEIEETIEAEETIELVDTIDKAEPVRGPVVTARPSAPFGDNLVVPRPVPSRSIWRFSHLHVAALAFCLIIGALVGQLLSLRDAADDAAPATAPTTSVRTPPLPAPTAPAAIPVVTPILPPPSTAPTPQPITVDATTPRARPSAKKVKRAPTRATTPPPDNKALDEILPP